MEDLELNTDFWLGKRVFLTGHTGFKGSWLSLWLQHMGAELTGFSLKAPTTPSLFELAKVSRGMQSITGDIRDVDSLKSSLKAARPEIVIHMAAQSLVKKSYHSPIETYSTNVMGTVHLLEAVRQTDTVHAVVNVTSDKCYENREWAWGYRENDQMGGYDPYSNSKGCAELVSAAYRSSFFNPSDYGRHGVALATARAGNVIGGGDWAKDRLIPDILSAFSSGNKVQIRHPDAVRPWQHVLEPLSGYLALAQSLAEKGSAFATGWNFGPNDEDAKSVGWIVKQMATRWGKGAGYVIDQVEHAHEANYLKLDISKARTELGWRPTLRLNNALDMIVDWAKAQQSGADISALTEQQISSYQKLRLD
jgi:CDP-glucose 4,6-dehydratase